MQTRQDIENYAKEICIKFNLGPTFDNVYAKNPSNSLPYHNWYHTCCVIVNCFKGASYHNLPYDAVKDLLLAAMFHDFAHSGGPNPDSANIAIAINHLNEMYYGIYDVDKIANIIKCTEYPFINEPYCIEQKILRDADIMQWLMPSAEEMILNGLLEEVKKSGKEFTTLAWIDAQISFMKYSTLYSDWGKEVFANEVYGPSKYARHPEYSVWPVGTVMHRLDMSRAAALLEEEINNGRR